MTTITIHENAPEEQVQKVVAQLEGLLTKFGVTEWKREGRKITFDQAISSEDKGTILMVPRVVSIATE